MDSWKNKKEELLRRLKEEERSFLKSVSASADLAGGYEDERDREAFKDVQRDAFWVYLAGRVISDIENADIEKMPEQTLEALLLPEHVLGDIVQTYEEQYDKAYGDDVDELAEKAVWITANCYL